MDQQKRIEKLAPGQPTWERVKLRAVADSAKQSFGLVGRNAEQRDRAARRSQQPGHQVHQRRLPGAVRSDEAGDARRDLQIHAVHAEYLAVELGDVVEDDELIGRNRHRSTLRPRKLSPATTAGPGKPHKSKTTPPTNTTEAVRARRSGLSRSRRSLWSRQRDRRYRINRRKRFSSTPPN